MIEAGVEFICRQRGENEMLTMDKRWLELEAGGQKWSGGNGVRT